MCILSTIIKTNELKSNKIASSNSLINWSLIHFLIYLKYERIL